MFMIYTIYGYIYIYNLNIHMCMYIYIYIIFIYTPRTQNDTCLIGKCFVLGIHIYIYCISQMRNFKIWRNTQRKNVSATEDF